MESANDGDVTRGERQPGAECVDAIGDEAVQAEDADNRALESGADLDEWLADEAGYGYGV